MDEGKYIRELEDVIRKFLQPLQDVPYSVAIKVLTGCRVLHFDPSIDKNRNLLELLSKAANLAGTKASQVGIFARRPNEAGNKIEQFVISALKDVGLKAGRPKTKTGKLKTAGYPDIEIVDSYGRVVYLDCKTYSARTKAQSFRTFYFSPSIDPKITRDAYHFLLSFELVREQKGNRMPYIPIAWQLYTLENLRVKVKHEFNASNREIYRLEALLAEGKID